MDAEEIDVGVAYELWRAGDVFIDVRTAEEYAAGHIPGARNIPVDRIAFALEELPDGQVITVCSMGNRSRRAAETLARLGKPALTLRGGAKAWQAARRPIATGSEPGTRRKSSLIRMLFKLD